MKKRLIWILIAAAASGLIGYSVVRRVRPTAPVVEDAGGVPVAVASPRRGDVERTLSYAGTLSPAAVVTLTPKVTGKIERIFVKEGDLVRQGQLVARMEDDVVSLQARQAASALEAARAQREKARKGVRPEELANAEASLAQAEKDFASAQESFGRAERLYKGGTITRARFEEAERTWRGAETQLANARRSVAMMQQGAGAEEQGMAEANLKALQAQYELAKLQADNTRVLSPIAGRVAKLLIDEGNMASLATGLLVIVRDDEMSIRIPLPEKLYGEFHERGTAVAARVTPAALPNGKPFAGRLDSISPTVDPASRTFTAEVRIGNAGGSLRAGMYANVDFVLERAENALLVPLSAIVKRGEKQGVFILEEPLGGLSTSPLATARFREVGLGLRDASSAQVTGGLSETDRIVVEGNAFLEDGQAVAPRG